MSRVETKSAGSRQRRTGKPGLQNPFPVAQTLVC